MILSLIRIFYTYKRSLILILVWVASSFHFSQEIFSLSREPYRLQKVVIDPGHGGKDPGAVGRKSMEKDIVLSISLKLGKYIEENFKDVEVIYTRKEDVFVELFKRADIANSGNADLFISIHANASPDKMAYGTETYAMGLHTSKENLDVAKKENKAILFEEDYTNRYEGYDPNSPESFIVFSLMQNTFLYQSLDFATYIQHQFRERVKRFDRGVKQAGFLVLWRTTMPSVLIEVGFVSNPDEEKYLISEDGQNYIASSIYRAFREYKDAIELKSNGNGRSSSSTQFPIASGTSQIQNQNSPGVPSNKKDEVVFRVQVSASSNKVNLESDIFKGMEHVSEFHSGGIFRYTVGLARTLAEAGELKKKINEKFPDAFLVASHNGKLISIQEAMKHLNP